MRLDIHHHFHGTDESKILTLLQALKGQGETHMADMQVLINQLTDLKATAISESQFVQAKVSTLSEHIAALEAQVATGTASPEAVKLVEEIKAIVEGIDPTNPATLPVPE